jgi:hypothetical protein
MLAEGRQGGDRRVSASASTTPTSPSHVDVTLTEHDGSWLAVAMLADEPDIGTGEDPREALRAAVAALGEPYASEMAASAELPARTISRLTPLHFPVRRLDESEGIRERSDPRQDVPR